MHSLEWPTQKRLIMPSVGEDVEQRELSYIAGGNAHWYGQNRKQLGNFLPYDPYDPIPKNRKTNVTKDLLYPSVYSGYIHNHPQPETSQVSIKRRTGKHTVVYPYSEILFKREQGLLYGTIGTNLKSKTPIKKRLHVV